jgi:tetratricopeptide (TPR) repeat protein
VIAVDIAPKTLELTGEAQLVLSATADGRRAVPLELGRDLVVDSVRGPADTELAFTQQNRRLVVALAEPADAGDAVTLTVAYRGRIFDKRDSARVLRTSTGWYPRSGEPGDRATYDVTFEWPKQFDLLATGQRIEGGAKDDQLWERRRFDSAEMFFSFEIGKFDLHTSRAGDIPITLALDPLTRSSVRKEVTTLLEVASDALAYYEEIFGDYPYPDLTIVTLPRWYSQAPPGFITLDRFSARQAAADEETENRWVLAHEIAHQWWGHRVGWRSYRDQWLSEAMANYAALLFVRNRGEGKRLGPTQGWQSALSGRTRDGRQIESLGPIVLGTRLVSSLSAGAYGPIVYRKGAVIIDMLARSFGEETFLAVLRSMMRGVQGRSISTEDFFDLIERITDADLEAFTDQFIYNTGLPQVYYDYAIERNDDGDWVVSGEAIQNSPYRLEYSLVRRANGQLDVDSRQVVQIDVDRSTLVVPVQAVLYDPEKQSDAEDPSRTGNTVLQIHTVVRGRRTPFAFRMPHEPKQFWLDARGEVFGRFFSQKRHPKRVLYYRGVDLAAAERWDEATTTLRAALAAKPFDGLSWGKEEEESERAVIRERYGMDARIHWRLMRMHLAQGHTNSAQSAFEAAEEAWREVEKTNRSYYSRMRKPSYATVLEARLDLQKRNPRRAYEVLKAREVSSREWYLTMALAARDLGKEKDYEEAIEEAEERGADVSLLTEEVLAVEDR